MLLIVRCFVDPATETLSRGQRYGKCIPECIVLISLEVIFTMPHAAIRIAYQAGHGKWAGCDWTTAYGPRRLDLAGIQARQARLIANATTGDESKAWNEAAQWLDDVEHDAATAETEALIALNLVDVGQLAEAEQHAFQACQLENRYQRASVWHDLLMAIRHAQSNAVGGGMQSKRLV